MKKYLNWFNSNINNIYVRIKKGNKLMCSKITETEVITSNGEILPLKTISLYYKDIVLYFTQPIEKNIFYIKNKIIYNGYHEWFISSNTKVINEWNYYDGINLVNAGFIKSKRVSWLVQLGTKCVRCDRVGVKFLMTIDRGGSLHFDLYDKDNNLMNIDHILPKSRGGKDIIENYQLMCEECNSKKGNTLEEKIIFNFDKFINKN